MDLVRRNSNKPATAADPWAAAPTSPSAVPQPYTAPTSRPAPQLRVGLVPWLFGHTLRVLYRTLTATIIHDRPSSVLSKDPSEHGRFRRVSAAVWSVFIPLAVLVTAGPLPAAALTVIGLFLLVRHRAARESIAVTPTSLCVDARILAESNKAWLTILVTTGALALAGTITSFFALGVGQLLLAGAWLLAIAFFHAAAVRGVEELEDTDLSTGLERGVLALGAATNRGLSSLHKPGKDVVAR